MARLYLLDTNMMIASLKGSGEVRQRLETETVETLCLSAVVLGELLFGVEKSRQGERSRAHLTKITQGMRFVAVDRAAAEFYARLRAHLERRGTPIGSNDLWIAAQALAIGATLVTDNEREFSRVPDLRIENWLRG